MTRIEGHQRAQAFHEVLLRGRFSRGVTADGIGQLSHHHPSFLMLYGQAAYWTALRRHPTAYQSREQKTLFLPMVEAIRKRAQEHHDTLQKGDIHRFSTFNLLCQDRHAGHHLLDNSMFRLQHFNRRCLAHLISLSIMRRSPRSSSAWISCGMALSNPRLKSLANMTLRECISRLITCHCRSFILGERPPLNPGFSLMRSPHSN